MPFQQLTAMPQSRLRLQALTAYLSMILLSVTVLLLLPILILVLAILTMKFLWSLPSHPRQHLPSRWARMKAAREHQLPEA